MGRDLFQENGSHEWVGWHTGGSGKMCRSSSEAGDWFWRGLPLVLVRSSTD